MVIKFYMIINKILKIEWIKNFNIIKLCFIVKKIMKFKLKEKNFMKLLNQKKNNKL